MYQFLLLVTLELKKLRILTCFLILLMAVLLLDLKAKPGLQFLMMTVI